MLILNRNDSVYTFSIGRIAYKFKDYVIIVYPCDPLTELNFLPGF